MNSKDVGSTPWDHFVGKLVGGGPKKNAEENKEAKRKEKAKKLQEDIEKHKLELAAKQQQLQKLQEKHEKLASRSSVSTADNTDGREADDDTAEETAPHVESNVVVEHGHGVRRGSGRAGRRGMSQPSRVSRDIPAVQTREELEDRLKEQRLSRSQRAQKRAESQMPSSGSDSAHVPRTKRGQAAARTTVEKQQPQPAAGTGKTVGEAEAVDTGKTVGTRQIAGTRQPVDKGKTAGTRQIVGTRQPVDTGKTADTEKQILKDFIKYMPAVLQRINELKVPEIKVSVHPVLVDIDGFSPLHVGTLSTLAHARITDDMNKLFLLYNVNRPYIVHRKQNPVYSEVSQVNIYDPLRTMGLENTAMYLAEALAAAACCSNHHDAKVNIVWTEPRGHRGLSSTGAMNYVLAHIIDIMRGDFKTVRYYAKQWDERGEYQHGNKLANFVRDHIDSVTQQLHVVPPPLRMTADDIDSLLPGEHMHEPQKLMDTRIFQRDCVCGFPNVRNLPGMGNWSTIKCSNEFCMRGTINYHNIVYLGSPQKIAVQPQCMPAALQPPMDSESHWLCPLCDLNQTVKIWKWGNDKDDTDWQLRNTCTMDGWLYIILHRLNSDPKLCDLLESGPDVDVELLEVLWHYRRNQMDQARSTFFRRILHRQKNQGDTEASDLLDTIYTALQNYKQKISQCKTAKQRTKVKKPEINFKGFCSAQIDALFKDVKLKSRISMRCDYRNCGEQWTTDNRTNEYYNLIMFTSPNCGRPGTNWSKFTEHANSFPFNCINQPPRAVVESNDPHDVLPKVLQLIADGRLPYPGYYESDGTVARPAEGFECPRHTGYGHDSRTVVDWAKYAITPVIHRENHPWLLVFQVEFSLVHDGMDPLLVPSCLPQQLVVDKRRYDFAGMVNRNRMTDFKISDIWEEKIGHYNATVNHKGLPIVVDNLGLPGFNLDTTPTETVALAGYHAHRYTARFNPHMLFYILNTDEMSNSE